MSIKQILIQNVQKVNINTITESVTRLDILLSMGHHRVHMIERLPTYQEHFRAENPFDRRSYIARYLAAVGLPYEGGENGAVPRGPYADMARIAFGYVQASSRLSDITQSIPGDTQRIAAQRADVEAWDTRADTYLARGGSRQVYNGMVADFSGIAEQARVPNEKERERIHFATKGQINDLVVAAPPVTYAWQLEGNGSDSALNRAPSRR